MNSTTASRVAGSSHQVLEALEPPPTSAEDCEPAACSSPLRNLSPAPLTCSPLHVQPARAGDHASIQRLLNSLQRLPSEAEFQCQLDDPLYEPADRLVGKYRGELVAHVRLVWREMQFARGALATAALADLAILPEYSQRGFGEPLLEAADRELQAGGAALGWMRTLTPSPWMARGWLPLRDVRVCRAAARDLLSELRTHTRAAEAWETPKPVYNIRLWRHVELAALIRLYHEHVAGWAGPVCRSEPLWRWLVERHAFDRIYIAVAGADDYPLDDVFHHIVGYAVIRDGRLLEFVVNPSHPEAGRQILARACADVMERGLQDVLFEGPAGHPLHAIFAQAGERAGLPRSEPLAWGPRSPAPGWKGRPSDRSPAQDCGRTTLVKIVDESAVLRARRAAWQERRGDPLDVPGELGLLLDGQKSCLISTPQETQRIQGRLGRSFLRCSTADYQLLLLGQLDLEAGVQQGRVSGSTRAALDTAHDLFPPLAWWRPCWDELPARGR